MTGVRVSKAGGTSADSREDLAALKRLFSDEPSRKVLVLSAPSGVTDLLIRLARGESVLEKVLEKYSFYPQEDVEWVRGELKSRLSRTGLSQPEFEDLIKAAGEYTNARNAAKFMGARLVDASEFLLVTPNFGNARIMPESGQLIRGILGQAYGGFWVVPGFYGTTELGEKGKIATFDRGGSDLSGARIAADLGAVVYEKFTDTVLMAAPPGIVQNPRKIMEITYREMSPFSFAGGKILQRAAMGPVAQKRIPTHIMNLANPLEGTYIVSERVSDPDRPIIGVTYRDGFCAFQIERFELNTEVGLEAILGIFGRNDIPIEVVPSGVVDDLSVFVHRQYLDSAKIAKVENELEGLTGVRGSVNFLDSLGILVVVGKGMAGTVGIGAEVLGTLKRANVNIKAIGQSTSEISIMYGISHAHSGAAVNAIYDKFIR